MRYIGSITPIIKVEIEIAIARERKWIAAFLRSKARGDTVVAALQDESIAEQIARGDYPRPQPKTAQETNDADQ